ncbi:phosphoribosylglycinamide formyltransferase 2, partial [Hafnia paralvei]
TQLRLFGKPEIDGTRRLGVALAYDETVEKAIALAKQVSNSVVVKG